MAFIHAVLGRHYLEDPRIIISLGMDSSSPLGRNTLTYFGARVLKRAIFSTGLAYTDPRAKHSQRTEVAVQDIVGMPVLILVSFRQTWKKEKKKVSRVTPRGLVSEANRAC